MHAYLMFAAFWKCDCKELQELALFLCVFQLTKEEKAILHPYLNLKLDRTVSAAAGKL